MPFHNENKSSQAIEIEKNLYLTIFYVKFVAELL